MASEVICGVLTSSYVSCHGHFLLVETTIEVMHRLITTTRASIPYHLIKICLIITAEFHSVHIWYRITFCQLVEQH